MATNGHGWAYAGLAAGGVFLWSALYDKSILGTLRDLLQGKKPVPGSVGASMFASQSGVGSGASSVTAVAPAGPGATANAIAILKSLGAPLTHANINSLVNWQAREGANTYNNPLNTTLPTSGSVGVFNSQGVQEYGTPREGIAATVATLLGGNFNSIVQALKSGIGLGGNLPGVAGELLTWSGGGYSSV